MDFIECDWLTVRLLQFTIAACTESILELKLQTAILSSLLLPNAIEPAL